MTIERKIWCWSELFKVFIFHLLWSKLFVFLSSLTIGFYFIFFMYLTPINHTFDPFLIKSFPQWEKYYLPRDGFILSCSRTAWMKFFSDLFSIWRSNKNVLSQLCLTNSFCGQGKRFHSERYRMWSHFCP